MSKDPSFIVIGKLSDESENLGVTENNNIQQYNDFLCCKALSSICFYVQKIVSDLNGDGKVDKDDVNILKHFQHFRTIEFVSNPMSTYRMDP